MSYKNANHIFPPEMLQLLQQYAEGEYIYIPKKETSKKEWGSNTDTKQATRMRNEQIFHDYQNGCTTAFLAEKYFLSLKSIQRIILQYKSQS